MATHCIDSVRIDNEAGGSLPRAGALQQPVHQRSLLDTGHQRLACVLRISNKAVRLQEEHFDHAIMRLQRELTSLQDGLGEKQERMKVLDRFKADRQQLANLDDLRRSRTT